MKILLLFCLLFPNLNDYVLISDGEVIEEEGMHNQQSIASISKIMTTLVALETTEIGEVVVVDERMVNVEGSSIYLELNQKYTLYDLLNGLMLRSGNDAAQAIAYTVSGSIEGFVELMNDKAQKLGMKDTIFRNPSGLDEDGGNISTCYDMALLMSAAMKNEVFRIIASNQYYLNSMGHTWQNKNKLLFTYPYANGGKTGYTMKAGKTLVTSANNGSNENIVVSFRENEYFSLHQKLHELAFKTLDTYLLIEQGDYRVRGKTIHIDEDVYMLKRKEDTFQFDMKYEKDGISLSFTNYDQTKEYKWWYV